VAVNKTRKFEIDRIEFAVNEFLVDKVYAFDFLGSEYFVFCGDHGLMITKIFYWIATQPTATQSGGQA
jgi:hypothetical protein